MEQSFYREKLEQQGLEVITPTIEERDLVHRVIYEELCLGQVLPASKVAYQQIIENLVRRGAKAIVLGCTEISMLIQPSDFAIPLYDTTAIHALAAADQALAQE